VRAIAQSYPTLNPQPAPKNEMQLIIPLPPMTKETRLENQKKAKDLADKQKILVRNIRQDQLKVIKSAFKEDPAIGKDAVTRVEKDTDKEMKKTLEEIDRITEQIKKDIMVA
jgi:ribosome recycling factor